MKIWVCDKTKVPKMQSRHGITHVLSLLDHGDHPFLHPLRTNKANCMMLNFPDTVDSNDPSAPTMDHVRMILAWGERLPEDANVLVHCFAGISRSTAATLAIMIQREGIDKIDECITRLLEQRPQACPNPLIIKYADELLGAGGKLFDAVDRCDHMKLVKLLGWPPNQI